MLYPFQPDPVIDRRTLVAVIIACIIGSFLCIPTQHELVQRMDQDGNVERLHELAAERLTPVKVKTDRERLRDWLEMSDEALRQDPAVQADVKNMCAATESPQALSAELIAHASVLSPALFGYLADALAGRALGLGQPEQAAVILEDLCARAPDWPRVQRAVQAWRWSARSDVACALLEKALANGFVPALEATELLNLRVDLALESNHPNLAFDLLHARYNAVAGPEKAALLRRLVDLARDGDRTAEAADLIDEHLAALPFHKLPLAEAIAQVQAGTAFANAEAQADYTVLAADMARWQEWAGQGCCAFETWLRLAVLDHAEGWQRVREMYDDVVRGDDFARVLAARIAQGKSLDLEPDLAALLTDEGHTNEALAHYLSAARRSAQPAPLLHAAAHLHLESCEWADALALFDRLLKSDAADLPARKGRVEALVGLSRYPEAATVLVQLSAALPQDAWVQERCANVCSSLGMASETLAANRRLLSCAEHVASADEHLDVAEQLRAQMDEKDQMTALKVGLAQFPESTRLRCQLGETLACMGAHAEAVAVLLHPSLMRHPHALKVLISEALMADSDTAHRVLASFGNEVPDCLAQSPEAMLRLAFLQRQHGDPEHSQQIIARLLDASRYGQARAWHDLAALAEEFDDGALAVDFQTRYTRGPGKKDSQGWSRLGDLYQAHGELDQASTAYRCALSLLRRPAVPALASTLR